MSIFQKLAGNFMEVSKEELMAEFSQYLVEGEIIEIGFKLVRDTLIFTNLRILDFDKQGATGKKMRVSSIYLDSIYSVSCETAGAGLDDSEINISCILTPYRKSNNPEYAHKKYEFPKKYDITPLYIHLENIVQANLKKWNS